MKRPRWWFQRRADELSEEIETHLTMAIHERVARGESVERATAAARREFGNSEVVRATTRDMWGWIWLEQLALDVRYALRRLRLAPGFTAVATLSLAIGIGATVTMYAVIDAADIRALPLKHAQRLVVLTEMVASPMPDGRPGRIYSAGTSAATFGDWRRLTHSYDGMAVANDATLVWLQSDEVEHVQIPAVSPDFFALLGTTPVLGRGVMPSDTMPDAAHVLVLSYGFWRQRFQGDRHVIGQSLQLAESDSLSAPRQTYTIVGVMPQQVDFPEQAQGWQPARAVVPTPARSVRGFEVLARLRPGQTVQSANRELSVITARIAAQDPNNFVNASVRVQTLAERQWGRVSESYAIEAANGRDVRLAIASVVLLVALINVSNLLVARSAARDHEIRVRIALGASRGRLAQSLLVESGCIAIAGGVVGVIATRWIILAMSPRADVWSPGEIVPVLNARVLFFSLALTALVAMGIASLPLLSFMRAGGSTNRNETPTASSGRTRARLQGGLLVAQIAAALTLLTGAGLLSKELIRLSKQGFDYDPVNLMAFPYPQLHGTGAARREFRNVAMARLARTRGVVSSAEMGVFGESFFPPGEPEKAERRVAYDICVTVSPGFLKTLRIPLRRGRDFTDADFAVEAPVAIISAAAADRFWPGQDPIGKQVLVTPGTVALRGDPKRDTLTLTIVGMVANPRLTAVLGPPPLTLLRPNALSVGLEMYFVRTAPPFGAATAAVRRIFTELRGAPLVRDSYGFMQTLSIDRALADQRLTTRALIAFAVVALFLAALGIHGMVVYAVTQRTREIGIRMALGAEASSVVLLVTRRGLWLAVAGIGLGLIGALAVTDVLSAMLYGTSPTDPVVFVGSALVLATVALVAGYIPARHATRIDPMVALRVE